MSLKKIIATRVSESERRWSFDSRCIFFALEAGFSLSPHINAGRASRRQRFVILLVQLLIAISSAGPLRLSTMPMKTKFPSPEK